MIHVNCNICGRDEWRVRFAATTNSASQPEVDVYRCTCSSYGHHLRIVKCRHCGHVYTNPRWEGAELLDDYAAVEDETYVLERAGRRRTFAHHLRALEKFTGPGACRPLLDVGAYIGIFVEVARFREWQAMGVEPSNWASGIAQEQGLPVLQGTLDMAELSERRFDVITMWDVIEHLDDPTAELVKSYALLAPGGLIIVHTMDINSLTARLMGRRWPWLMDMHVQYFNRNTLKKMLEGAGFEVVWIGAQGRYLTLGYLASRVGGLSEPLGRLISSAVKKIGISQVTVPVNFGDLFTVYARRPSPISNEEIG